MPTANQIRSLENKILRLVPSYQGEPSTVDAEGFTLKFGNGSTLRVNIPPAPGVEDGYGTAVSSTE